jgi:hypothetical protein
VPYFGSSTPWTQDSTSRPMLASVKSAYAYRVRIGSACNRYGSVHSPQSLRKGTPRHLCSTFIVVSKYSHKTFFASLFMTTVQRVNSTAPSLCMGDGPVATIFCFCGIKREHSSEE